MGDKKRSIRNKNNIKKTSRIRSITTVAKAELLDIFSILPIEYALTNSPNLIGSILFAIKLIITDENNLFVFIDFTGSRIYFHLTERI
jgi:hypothetical protein